MDRQDILRQLEQEIPHLRRFARFLARDADLADDLVQDCLTRAVANLESWQPGTNLRAWLFVILRNVYINELRRGSRNATVELPPDHGGAPSAPGGQEINLTLRDLQAAFDRLSEEHREILVLVAIEGLQYEEAAAILNIAVGTVRSRLSRARVALKELFGGSTTSMPGQN